MSILNHIGIVNMISYMFSSVVEWLKNSMEASDPEPAGNQQIQRVKQFRWLLPYRSL